MTRSQALTMLRKAKKPKRRCSLELRPAERIAKRKEAKVAGLCSIKQLYFVQEYKRSGCIKQAQQAAKASQTTVNGWLKQPKVKELLRQGVIEQVRKT